MTLSDALQDVWEALGEPTDLEFRNAAGAVDTTSAGWSSLLRGLQRGIIATMRFKEARNGRRLKWPGSTKITSRAGGRTETLTVASVTGGAITTVENVTDDTYIGWLVEYNDELRRVAYSSGTLLAVTEAFSSEPSPGDTLLLRQSFVSVSAVDGVLRVTDTTNGRDLEVVRPEDVTWDTSPTAGDPTRYYHLGDRLHLDPPPDTERYFYLELETYPDVTSLGADEELSIPEPLQYSVILWTTAWGFGRYLNPEMKRALRREWRESLLEIQLPEDNILDRADDSFDLRQE